MEPRRSTRASSAKPAARSTAKPVVRTTSQQLAGKRSKAASPEPEAAPAPKRARSAPPKPSVAAEKKTRAKPLAEVKNKANGLARTKSRSKLSPVRENGAPPAPAARPVPPKYFNPLPTPPEHLRPGLQLFAWGAGNFGQFGMGPDQLNELHKPKKSAWAEEKMEDGAFGEVGAGFESVMGGGLHSLFIDEKGTVWSCGVNDDAALGRVTQNVPDPEKPGSFLDIDDLTSYPHPLQTLVDQKFRAIKLTAGDTISAALSADGDLRVWGSFRANEGSLGFASGLKHQFTPVSILDIASKANGYEKAVDMASGGNHLVVLTTHGNLYTWGAGEQAQLGRKILERRKINGTVPEKVLIGKSRKAVIIGSGSYHSFAVDDTGDVWGWGLNTMGQTGTGHSGSADDAVLLPRKVIGLSKSELGGSTVIKIDGGEHHTVFLTSDGKVYACGRSNGGQLGLPDDHPAFADREEPDFLAEPTLVPFPEEDDPIVHISCGPHYSMAVSRDGALYSWGQGTQSELGAGDEEEIKTPRMIVRREGGSWKAVSVSCGGQHCLGLFRKKN